MKDFDLSAFLADLRTLCAIDSGHFNAPGTAAVADFFESRYRALGLKTERRYYDHNDFAPFLTARNSEDEQIDVLFVAHMDTVFPVGTGAQWPLEVDADGLAHGPGRPNEEFVSQRKGGANYIFKCHGISAHSGVEPEKGASAILELSRWVNELYKLNDFAAGTTVNVGRFDGGGDNGAVPDYAECTLSYRYLDASALDRLEALLQRMQAEPFDPRTHMEIIQKSLRPAMQPHAATYALLYELERAGEAVGQKVTCLVTGGGSDGNFISHYGVATLDGCGPCGGKLHTREEYLMTKTVEQRLDLMYVLLTRLFRRCPD